MKRVWINSVLPIAAIFAFRMLGLFMLIPVFSVYADNLKHASPALIGIALGSYGLSQGVLQIPFGMLSDRFGRKSILTLGLVFFAAGSVLGGIADSIYTMIVARILQGIGAIGSVLIALLADLTPDKHRTKSMAMIGATIGLSFITAMILSPAIAGHFGLAGIFYCTALLAIAALLLLHFVIPTPPQSTFNTTEASPTFFRSVIKNPHLQRLNLGIFCQHFILTATFFMVPLILKQFIAQNVLTTLWHFYLPLMTLSFLSIIPIIIVAEKKQTLKTWFTLAICATSITQLLLSLTYHHWSGFCLLLFIYFAAFNILEATLPSLVSKQAPQKIKGSAMGVYSSSQFLGIFCGGASSGFMYQAFGGPGLFILNALISIGWLTIAFKINADSKPLAQPIT